MFLLSWRAPALCQGGAAPALMPLPQKIQPGAGRFLINNNFRVALQGPDDMRVKHAAKRFQSSLSRITGIPLGVTNNRAIAPNFIIHWRAKGEKPQRLGEDESYRLEVTATEVHLDAPTPLGVLHGLQTFLQLVQIGPEGFAAPVVVIEDSPRFPWRGLLIDV